MTSLLTVRVVGRFLTCSKLPSRTAFKYEPKESKQSKVKSLMRLITDSTGINRATAEDVANAIIRNRDLRSLAIQKNWPQEIKEYLHLL